MSSEIASQGSLFTSDFLTETIQSVSEWSALGDADLDQFGKSIRAQFDRFPISQTPNESQTEDDLIWPILEALGWTESLRQQNLSPKGREDVPDGLLFESAEVKAKANGFPEEWKRYEFGRAVVESKRWARPLDRRSGRRGEETAPSTRLDVKERKDKGDVFSETAARYWGAMADLFMAIDQGDASIGLPPYNGGLFDQERHAILTNIRIPDAVMARVIDALSFENTPDGRKYINYRNLSVQQLGSIYERLLEYEVTRDGDEITVQPNIFARKGSGSYYTPDDLVQLILTETLEPLVEGRKRAFLDKVKELGQGDLPDHRKIGQLKRLDPATALLDLKICDPAMGSGHFLVSLVDFMADQVITAMAEAELEAPEDWGDYISPLGERIDTIRNTILANADERNWTIDEEQLDDRHIIRRMVLKRCIYGVDKNPMAVELAKVALWLHTFTVGAPLSFLDHHLRCGDSLFGSWVNKGIDKAATYGTPLLLHEPMKRALRAASKMQIVEGLTDAEIAEAHRSADVFAEVEDMTAPLDALLKLIHALDWLGIKDKNQKAAIKIFFDGQFGDPLDIAMGKKEPKTKREEGQRFAETLKQARTLIAEENFLNWQVAFPGIWSDWEEEELTGGFHAVIGNPPWDVMEFEEVPWFSARNQSIALEQTDAKRKTKVDELKEANDPLYRQYQVAAQRVAAGAKLVRSKNSDYSMLNAGKLNLYGVVARIRQ